MTSSEAMITLPFKYEWNDKESFQKWHKGETIESTLFGPENFKFKLRLKYSNLLQFIYLINLILVSSVEPTLNFKYKIIVNLTSNENSTFGNDKPQELSVGKECRIGHSGLISANSFQCDFELIFPYEPELKTLVKDFNSLRLKSRFTDVTFVIGKKEFPVNKMILCARSPVFEVMFSREEFVENQQNLVDIVDIDENVFEALLDFIYTSRVKKLDEIADKLLISAHKYDIKSLVQMCTRSLMKSLVTNNAVYYLMLAKMYSLTDLKDSAIDLINRNAQEVTNSEHFIKHVKPDQSLMQELYQDIVKKCPRI